MLQRKSSLIVLILILSVLSFSLALRADHVEEFNKVLPLKATGVFSLKNVNGSVILTTWKEEKVEIKAIKSTDRDAENLKKVEIKIDATPDFVSVDTIYPKWRNVHVKVEYEVKVPEGVNLPEISTVNGTVEISGSFRKVTASTVNGQVNLAQTSGDIMLSTTNGDIKAKDIQGKLEAETVNGGIELDSVSVGDGIKAKTVNGSLTLRLGSIEKLDAFLKAHTTNGGITLDIPLSFQNIRQSKHSFEGQIGQGGPEIYLETVNGGIKITK